MSQAQSCLSMLYSLVGVGAELFYVRNGKVNNYALAFKMPVPPAQEEVIFQWHMKLPEQVDHWLWARNCTCLEKRNPDGKIYLRSVWWKGHILVFSRLPMRSCWMHLMLWEMPQWTSVQQGLCQHPWGHSQWPWNALSPLLMLSQLMWALISPLLDFYRWSSRSLAWLQVMSLNDEMEAISYCFSYYNRAIWEPVKLSLFLAIIGGDEKTAVKSNENSWMDNGIMGIIYQGVCLAITTSVAFICTLFTVWLVRRKHDLKLPLSVILSSCYSTYSIVRCGRSQPHLVFL